VSILSNADASLRDRLRDGHRIHDLFDDVVCSADVGLAKPDAAIYRLAAERLGLPPAACVFVDDLPANVEAAREVGMQGVHHRVDKGDDLAAQLAALGITAGG
jgi:HAD superfamily hydrolase (TIGR01509 family)